MSNICRFEGTKTHYEEHVEHIWLQWCSKHYRYYTSTQQAPV